MPTDTNSLVYDYNTHRYYATIDGVKTKLNINLELDLGGNTEAEVFLTKATDTVYQWLFDYIRKEAIKVVEFRIANNFVGSDYGMPYRDGIEEAIYAQIEYMANFDGDLVAIAEHDKNKLVSVQVKNILKMYGLAHRGSYNQRISELDYRNGY